VVKPAARCPKGKVSLVFSARGARGIQGPTGPAGAQGRTGATGATGPGGPFVYASSSGTSQSLTTLITGQPGNVAELPLNGVAAATSPFSGGVIDTSATSPSVAQTFPTDGTITGLSIPVTAQTRAMLVVSASATGIALVNTVPVFISTSLSAR
jgi:hypothetical protein